MGGSVAAVADLRAKLETESRFEIVRREDFSDVTYLLEVRHPLMAKAARPGQFVIVMAHEHGERITFYYACEEAWSKTYRDKQVRCEAVEDDVKLLDLIAGATLALFADEPYLWMGNKDLPNTFFDEPGVKTKAERLPNMPHGLNDYQGFHNVVVLSALNPSPAHFHFLESYGINGEEVRTAHYRTAVYQAVMRCSIRNPADATPKRVVVVPNRIVNIVV